MTAIPPDERAERERTFDAAARFDFGAESAKAADAVMAKVRAERSEKPCGELDATLIVGDLKLQFGLTVYGTLQPRFPGSREQPEEREFIEIDRVMLSSRDGECDIYDALSWADLQNISDAILEAQP